MKIPTFIPDKPAPKQSRPGAPLTRESQIEKRLVQRVKELGGEVRKVQWLGRSGAPDRVVMRDGDREAVNLLLHADIENMGIAEMATLARQIVGLYTVWPEIKAPGLAATFPRGAHQLAQHREHERMRKMGQRVEVVDSYERIEEILK